MDQFREPEGAGGVCSGGTENPEDRTAEWIEGIRRGDADAFDAVAREYAVRATPTLFLIAKDGGRSPPVHAMEELPEPR